MRALNPPVALMGEIEENPLILGFEVLEARLEGALARLNAQFADALRAPLATTSSFPEFSAVLADLSVVYPMARALAEEFHPLPVRLAAARGEIQMPPEGRETDQLDGPAFDAAGELLYRARKEDRLLLIQGGGDTVDHLANALFLVLYRNLQGWTERQGEVVRLYRRHRRQREVAAALQITQQAVSSSLAAAGWKMIQEAETSLAHVFAGLEPPPPGAGS